MLQLGPPEMREVKNAARRVEEVKGADEMPGNCFWLFGFRNVGKQASGEEVMSETGDGGGFLMFLERLRLRPRPPLRRLEAQRFPAELVPPPPLGSIPFNSPLE